MAKTCPLCKMDQMVECDGNGDFWPSSDPESANRGRTMCLNYCPQGWAFWKGEQAVQEATYIANVYPIPERYRYAELWTSPGGPLEDTYRAVRRVVAQMKSGEIPPANITIIGPVGCGKTHLAAALANEFRRQKQKVVWASVTALLQRFRSYYGGSAGDDEAAITEIALNADWLVLDDIGKQQKTEWSDATLFNLIDGRYQSAKPVIVTGNAEDLGKLEPALQGRLREGSHSFRIDTKDRRERSTLNGQVTAPQPLAN